MQNLEFLYNGQNQMIFYAYFPTYPYFNPCSYSSPQIPYDLNSNSGTMVKKQEIKTHQNIQVSDQRQIFMALKNRHHATTKKNKRRNHRNKSKLIQSAKKNAQSNIINHVLTFLTKNKQSQAILSRAIKQLKKPQGLVEKIKQYFYNLLKVINLKRERKYINRKTVICLFTPQNLLGQLPQISQKLSQQNVINVEELCYLYRICVFYYLRSLSPMAILTSKRIEAIAKKIHLKRRNFVINQFLNDEEQVHDLIGQK